MLVQKKVLFRKMWVGVLLSFFVFTLLMLCNDVDDVYAIIQGIDIKVLCKASLFSFVLYVGRFFKWHVFLKILGINVPVHVTFPIFFAGLSMGITPGKVGEVIKCYLLEKSTGVVFPKSAPTIVAERATGVLGCVCLLTISLICAGSYYFEHVFFVIITFLGVLFAILFFRQNFVAAIIDKIVNIKCFGKYKKQINTFFVGVIKLLGLKGFLIGIAVSFSYWLIECMLFYTLMCGIGVDIGIIKAIVCLTSVSIFGGLTMLPGSMGVLEGGLLSMLLYEGIAFANASVIVILHRFFAMWSVVIVGGIILISKYRNFIFNL